VFLTLVAGTIAVLTFLYYSSDFYAQRQAASMHPPEAVTSNP
jgi:hypothetical protein